MRIKKEIFVLVVILASAFLISCSEEINKIDNKTSAIVIFSINDPHGRLENFAKIKPIIEEEKNKGNIVFFVSGGDLFSGNPIVDYHEEKGYPMIDLLNKTSMDVSVLGNHEFDYGQDYLSNRVAQAEFPFVCLNVAGLEVTNGSVEPYQLIERNGVRVVFVGLVETKSPGGFPLTHPKKIEGLQFSNGNQNFDAYKDLKSELNADVLVALTHQGQNDDLQLMNTYPTIDLTVGGHTNEIYGHSAGNGFMVMSGKYLETLGKTSIQIKNNIITSTSFEAIDLNQDLELDSELATLIEEYNNNPAFFVPLGNAAHDHNFYETGCFYTDGIRETTSSDLVIQNSGGIRNRLNEGTITPFDLYSIDPFGNGLETFEMTVGEIKTFLNQLGSSINYSANFDIVNNSTMNFILPDGSTISDPTVLTISMNDYISNVYQSSLPSPSYTYPLTTADYLIEYVKNLNTTVENIGCSRITSN